MCNFILERFSYPFFALKVFIEIIESHRTIFNWNSFIPSFYSNLSNRDILTHPITWDFLGSIINKNLITKQPIDQKILIAAYMADFKKSSFFWCLDCIIEKGFTSNPLELISSFILNYKYMPTLDFDSLEAYAIFTLKSLKFLNNNNQLINVLTNGTSQLSNINLEFIQQFCQFLIIDNLEVIANTIDIIKILHFKNREILKLCTKLLKEGSDDIDDKGLKENLETILKIL